MRRLVVPCLSLLLVLAGTASAYIWPIVPNDSVQPLGNVHSVPGGIKMQGVGAGGEIPAMLRM